MIAPLLERAARRATLADAALKTDETTTLEFGGGSLRSATTTTSQGLNLRLVVDGRLGFAGSVEDDPEELLDRAIASAAIGAATNLALPRQRPLPAVDIHVPRAAVATVPELAMLCHLVRDRLSSEHADLTMTLERSLGSVRVANTLGLDASYDVSEVSLGVRATRVIDGRRILIEGRLSGADLPSLPELEQLVGMVRQRLSWVSTGTELAAGRLRVAFLPTALPPLLLPVEQLLAGGTMPGTAPTARRGTRAFSELISLTDDPLVDGRPGSRPIDDEGVVSCPVALVKAGVVENLIYDLETAGRMGAKPTGHGRRSTFGKPQPAFSNLVLEAGQATWEEVLLAVGDGLVLERLRHPVRSNLMGGAFALAATLAWRVVGGEIIGVAPEMTVAGNAHDLLNRVVAVGREALWLGSRAMPALVVDGVSVF